VRISAVEAPASGVVTIAVEDDGAGVADADLDHLFEKFYRVTPHREGSRRGMGIGLTVAQGLTGAMGGTIGASRSALGGLAVTVTLPAAGRLDGEGGGT
jgi:signal transduction histidine kinase